MIYVTCPNCGSNNDPGERCDCNDRATKPDNKIIPPKGVIPSVNASNKKRPDIPTGGTFGGGICEPRHGLDGCTIFAGNHRTA